LEAAFAGTGVVFTTEKPAEGEYSTIHIGGDSEAFGGVLWGVAEKVDGGNQDHSDIAFVFSDNIPAGALAGVIAHELGHLLGYEHAHQSNSANPLAEVAFDPKVHVEIGNEARADAIEGDGKVSLYFDDTDDSVDNPTEHEYAVHPKLVAALTDWGAYYNAGSVGGDAFPDVVMGQFAIHPVEHGVWLTRTLDMAWAAQNDPWYTDAEKGQILA